MSENVIPAMLGESGAFLEMLGAVSALAPLNRPILILGERGTGKELVAQRLMFLSGRWNRPFVTVNCGALAEALLDSELFGHEAGAFTGAARRRASRFELADGGTMFLDEIGNAPAAVQEKLLRVIEYGAFERVGGNETVRVDVRVIAATNADLRGRVAAGGFRADLLDRLAFDVIRVPPLREREADAMVLARHFAARMTAELGRDVFAGFGPAAEAALAAHGWPGNVRELRNAVERSVCRMADPARPLDRLIIDPFGAPAAPIPPPNHSLTAPPDYSWAAPPDHSLAAPPNHSLAAPPRGKFRPAVDGFEKAMLGRALGDARFNQKRAAAALGLSYHQFRNALKRHGL